MQQREYGIRNRKVSLLKGVFAFVNSDCRFAAVIAAGGSGTRFGGGIPKQYAELDGCPVIAHTIRKFEDCEKISEIIIVSHRDYIVYCRDICVEFGFKKVTTIAEGGASRQESVFKGLKQLADDVTHVLIHDAARPAVSTDTIEKCCGAAAEYGACSAGARAVDTLKLSEDGSFVSATLDREKIWQIQTPQGFEKEKILLFHKTAAFEGFEATDDCALAEKYGMKVRLVESDRSNIKITNSGDLDLIRGVI